MPGRAPEREDDLSELAVAAAKWLWAKLAEALVAPPGGAGAVFELEPGNAVEEERMANAKKLMELCEQAVTNPAFIAHDITGDGKAETFCNRSVRFIAEGMGAFGYFRHDTSASQMVRLLDGRFGWREEWDFERIAAFAQKGALIIIGVAEEPHGHVVVAAPMPCQLSGSWGGMVPMVAHVGGGKTPNGIVKLSEAFRLAQRPRLKAYLWEESLA
jgi:hypothetical protein